MYRKKLFRAAAALLCAAMLLFTAPISPSGVVSAASTAQTTVYLNLRDAAGMSGKVLTTLPMGETLTVLDDSNAEWVKVRSSSGLEGWCSRQYLAFSGEPAAGSGLTEGGTALTTAYLNLRSSAGTGASILTTMPKGTIVTLLAAPSNGWVQVRTASGTTGYCSVEYLAANAASEPGGSTGAGGDGNTVTVAVTTANLKLRTGPAVSYTALRTMPQGTKLTVLDNSNAGWAKVQTSDGQTGWSSKEFLTITTEAGNSGSVSSAPSSQPSSESEPIGPPPSSGGSRSPRPPPPPI